VCLGLGLEKKKNRLKNKFSNTDYLLGTSNTIIL
jgi:hypothetical protein